MGCAMQQIRSSCHEWSSSSSWGPSMMFVYVYRAWIEYEPGIAICASCIKNEPKEYDWALTLPRALRADVHTRQGRLCSMLLWACRLCLQPKLCVACLRSRDRNNCIVCL